MTQRKNVLITGTNRGLGRAFVEEFAKKGFNVIAHARLQNEEHECHLKKISEQNGVDITPVYFDLLDKDSLKDNIQNLIKSKTKIDVLVNSAGIAHGGYFQMTKMTTIRDVFEINFFAQLELTQLLLRWMTRNGGGSIINLASNAGIDLSAGNCAYGVSKAAIIAFTKTLAAEYAMTKVRVNAVAPGLTDTQMADLMDEKSQNKMLDKTTQKRRATPKEIADTVIFLASDESSFVNGQIIRIDGGLE